MDVHEFAQRALFGTSLADKLTPWGDAADRRGPAVGSVAAPGRPPELMFAAERRVEPRIGEIRDDRDRARVLHELANHELQALELFALALLRWPDAPAGFRAGLITTFADEQRHLGMYLDRLAAVGGTLGEWPVSRVFWDVLAPIDRPEGFVAGMALCFETANLDFCQRWRARFTEAGDTATADVLGQVHADEIRHVAHGLGWFTRWTPGDRVDAWVRELPPPLSPARARGSPFDVAGRRRAGWTDAEIGRLRVLPGTRGRLPRVLTFDAGLEDVLADGRPSAHALSVSADLGAVPMFLAGAEDVVIAREPSLAHQVRLAEAGFPIPRFVASVEDLRGMDLARFEPWGPSPAQIDVPAREPAPAWDPRWRALSSKAETLRRAQQFAGRPGVVDPMGSLGVPSDLAGPWVIKAPYSTSGGGRLFGEGALTEAQRRWVGRRRDLLWQPWWTRLLDLSAHVTVTDAGVRHDGLTRFATGPRGAYAGTWLGPWWVGLEPALLRALHGAGLSPRAIGKLIEEAAMDAGTWAMSLGFRGPLSIDAAVLDTPAGLRVHPWLETNARRTLGRVGLALARRLAPGARGWWHVGRATPELRGFLDGAVPIVREGRLAGGVLPTTDPSQAVDLLTWLAIDG